MNEGLFGRGSGRSSSGAVGRALRVLMIRYDVGVEDAFELLVRGARRAGVDLRDLAVGIVHASRRSRGTAPRSCRLDRALAGGRPASRTSRPLPRR